VANRVSRVFAVDTRTSILAAVLPACLAFRGVGQGLFVVWL
jgi:hypothetical protein